LNAKLSFAHKGLLEKFENLLNGYYDTSKPTSEGLPPVAWATRELNLSSNYFGDLVKKETGKTAQESRKLLNLPKKEFLT